MAFDLDTYVVSTEAKEIELPLTYCEVCKLTGLQPSCEDHESALAESVTLRVKDIPRMRKEAILSESMSWDASGNTHFRPSVFKNECLKLIIVEAPWGNTSDMFLASLGDNELSDALDTLIPSASSNTNSSSDTIKKGP